MKGLSKDRYDETFASEDGKIGPQSARQRNAIRWRFAGGPIESRDLMLVGV